MLVRGERLLAASAAAFASRSDTVARRARLRELALDQLRKTGTVSPPVFLGERHDFRVQEARKALAENCSDIDKLRKHVRPLIQLTELESARCRLG